MRKPKTGMFEYFKMHYARELDVASSFYVGDAAGRVGVRQRKPAETSVRPAETSVRPAETCGRPAETSGRPAETSVRPAETSVRPAETCGPARRNQG
jgi:hypothetical protein